MRRAAHVPARSVHGADQPFYFSTEDLRSLLRKPSLGAVYKWIRRRKIRVIRDERTLYVSKREIERVCPALVRPTNLDRTHVSRPVATGPARKGSQHDPARVYAIVRAGASDTPDAGERPAVKKV